MPGHLKLEQIRYRQRSKWNMTHLSMDHPFTPITLGFWGPSIYWICKLICFIFWGKNWSPLTPPLVPWMHFHLLLNSPCSSCLRHVQEIHQFGYSIYWEEVCKCVLSKYLNMCSSPCQVVIFLHKQNICPVDCTWNCGWACICCMHLYFKLD